MARIIDFHAHIFPEAIAEKAAYALGRFYDFPVNNVATVDALKVSARAAGVEKVVVHSTATTPAQVEHINDFLKGVECDLFVPFGTIHPDYPEVEKELDRIYDMGLRGLKLHPDFQEFDADDKRAHKIYKKLAQLGLPLLIHSGDPVRPYSQPRKIARIKDVAPDLKIVAAHLGGYRALEEADKYIIGKDFYIDTSSALWYIAPQDAASIIRKHGADKVLFGTDYPIMSHEQELKRIDDLNLTPEERTKILYDNAARLLGFQSP